MADAPARACAPLLVLVTGHPCSGKSTLAAALAATHGLPVLAKDDFQEVLFDAGVTVRDGHSPAELANRLALGAARRLLADGVACLLDANLAPERWQAPVRALLEATGARLLQVRCSADGTVLVRRFAERAARRHAGHRDAERIDSLRQRLLGPPLAPLALAGELLEYRSDTGTADAREAVLAAVGAALRAGAGG